MRLLKKDTSFLWDERSQESFDTLKKALASALVLSPPDYSRDFLLYVIASQETICMVLVEENDELHENIIYYPSWNLVDAEFCYTHVDKLALATLHAVQHLRNYSLLC